MRGAGLLLGLLAAAAPAAAATASPERVSWSAGLSAEQIWTENVFGTEASPADAVLDGRGWAAWYPDPHLRAGATGRLVRFFENPALDHGHVQAALEGQWAGGGGRRLLTAGAAGAWRLNSELYAPYDYRDAALYVALKRWLTPAFTAQLRVDASDRAYPDTPWEDAAKVWLSARLNRSLPTRTSLTVSARAGWKRYDQAAPDTSGVVTGEAPRAALWDVSLLVAQSLSARLAARAWWTQGRLTESADAARQLAGFENPLLDEFSADGYRAGGALKAILPWNCTAELAGERARLDYPGRPPTLYDPILNTFLFDAGDQVLLGPGERRDTLTRVRLYADKRIVTGGARVTVRVNAEWTKQDSNDLYWAWDGWLIGGGAVLEF